MCMIHNDGRYISLDKKTMNQKTLANVMEVLSIKSYYFIQRSNKSQ